MVVACDGFMDDNGSMNMRPNPYELVGIGLYTVNDVAQLLKTPARTIRRWMAGYGYVRDGEVRQIPPLWQPDIGMIDGQLELSFRDLIELRFVRAFVGMGMDLRTVKSCMELARECVESDRPFSSGRFRTDGKTIFLESLHRLDEPALIDLRKNQYVFKAVVEQTFRDLDIEEDIVRRWRPYGGKDSIVVDPERSFGQPVAARFGVPTVVLAEAVEAEGSIARVAALYEVDRAVVRDAVKFHEELAAA